MGAKAVGNSAYGIQTSRSVTCEQVDGNSAVIGGVVVASPDPASVGVGYVQFFVDRGTTRPGDPGRDFVSLSLIGPVDDPAFPVGFPYVCPPAGGSPTLSPTYFQMDGGGVTV
jgi:hypothetical protein